MAQNLVYPGYSGSVPQGVPESGEEKGSGGADGADGAGGAGGGGARGFDCAPEAGSDGVGGGIKGGVCHEPQYWFYRKAEMIVAGRRHAGCV